MEKLIKILEEINPSIDYLKEEHLIDDHLLDSLSIISLISEIEDAYEVSIPMVEIVPANFNSVKAIFNLISSLND